MDTSHLPSVMREPSSPSSRRELEMHIGIVDCTDHAQFHVHRSRLPQSWPSWSGFSEAIKDHNRQRNHWGTAGAQVSR